MTKIQHLLRAKGLQRLSQQLTARAYLCIVRDQARYMRLLNAADRLNHIAEQHLASASGNRMAYWNAAVEDNDITLAAQKRLNAARARLAAAKTARLAA